MIQDKKKQLILGGILVAVGTLLLLQNYQINISDWFILGVGIILIITYFIKKKSGFLITGLILTYLGSIIFLDNIKIVPRDTFNYLLLMALGLSFLTVYFAKKIKMFIFPGFILPAIGIYFFIEKVSDIARAQIWPLIFMNLALAFLLIFIFEFKTYGYKLIIPTVVFFVIGLLSFMTVQGIINTAVWEKLLKNLWPLILIIVGAVIILKNAFARNKKDI